MSPLDDELRTLLSARADQVTPAPDPLAGVERRAHRIRRRRVAVGLAGAVVVIAAAGLAVPSVLPDHDAGAVQYATKATPSASSVQAISTWPARGAASPTALAFAREQYAQQTGRAVAEVETRQLWAGSPDNGPEVMLLLGGPAPAAGSAFAPEDVVLVYYAEDGVRRLAGRDPLDDGAGEVNRVIDVGSGPYVVAVGEPGTTQIGYSPRGEDDFQVMAQADGVSTFARTHPAGTPQDSLLFTLTNGDQRTVDVNDSHVDPPGPASAADFVLDPADPWAYRGAAAVKDSPEVEHFRQEWAAARGVRQQTVVLTPLYGEVYEPSRSTVVFYLARSSAGPWSWGTAEGTATGAVRFSNEHVLKGGETALVGALPGDELGRIIAVAAPVAGAALYAPDGKTDRAMTSIAAGVWTTALDGNKAIDQVVVLNDARDESRPIYQAPAPDVTG